MYLATGLRSSTVSFENMHLPLNRTPQPGVHYEYVDCAFCQRDWLQQYANARVCKSFASFYTIYVFYFYFICGRV